MNSIPLIPTEGRDEGLYAELSSAVTISRLAGARPSQVMGAVQDALIHAATLYNMTFADLLNALQEVKDEHDKLTGAKPEACPLHRLPLRRA